MRGARNVLLIGIVLFASIGLGLLASSARHAPSMSRSPDRASYKTWIGVPHESIHKPLLPRPPEGRENAAGDAESNDLRVFLANMARAKHDGNSIGIIDDSPIFNWSDDKQASDR